ncbi:hypothetical protein D3C75_830390 [compost metagenome]
MIFQIILHQIHHIPNQQRMLLDLGNMPVAECADNMQGDKTNFVRRQRYPHRSVNPPYRILRQFVLFRIDFFGFVQKRIMYRYILLVPADGERDMIG